MNEKSCDNKICINNPKCARHQAWLNGDKDCKTFGGTELKGCGKFIAKS
jgi:hypothetical protein